LLAIYLITKDNEIYLNFNPKRYILGFPSSLLISAAKKEILNSFLKKEGDLLGPPPS
jgi:hypothetical protein